MHERLTRNTRDSHQMTERALDVPFGFASLQNYRALLQRLWQVHSSYEERLSVFDWPSLGIEFESRRRSRWLGEDLLALGAGQPMRHAPPAAINTIEEAVGCLYVLEGSALGGRILLREALRLAEISITHGAQFLNGHGARTQAMWHAFLKILNTFTSDGIEAAAIERGALRAFGDFQIFLQVDSDSRTPHHLPTVSCQPSQPNIEDE
jgi:heme oxygenase